MKTWLIILLIIMASSSARAQVQIISHDSLMTEIVAVDVKSFKLDGNTFRQFRAHHFPITSDHFKPTLANVRDTSLLNDSAYIKTFKLAAYKKTMHRRTTGHYVLIGGTVAVGVLLVAALIVGIAFTTSFD